MLTSHSSFASGNSSMQQRSAATIFPFARSFVHVRGFTPHEATVCPEQCPIPRGILVRGLGDSGNGVVTVLDPQLRFRPKKNGTFVIGEEELLWGFREEGLDDTGPIHTLDDVYAKAVLPLIPSIVEGYNAAFLITGATDSGKFVTAYGSQFGAAHEDPFGLTGGWADAPGSSPTTAAGVAVPTGGSGGGGSAAHDNNSSTAAQGPSQQPPNALNSVGVVYRFCRDIFAEFDRNFEENSSLSVEVEVVEIQNEQYGDLLNPHSSASASRAPSSANLHRSGSVVARPGTSSFYGGLPSTASGPSHSKHQGGAGDDEPIKVIIDPVEGARLTGVTRATVSDSDQLEQLLRLALRPLKKRKTTHVVHLRFTEHFAFSDPERPGHTISKARRINTIFAVLCSPPPSFHRCVDAAVERDTGEKPNAVVPYRDSAFTKLYADIFMQGFHLTFINCVSPFFEHTKEAILTLQFALKVRKMRSSPRLNHDESLVELRKLADEVKGLRTEVVKQNASLNIVQEELDFREREILRKEMIFEEQANALKELRRRRAILEHAGNVQRIRSAAQQQRNGATASALDLELSQSNGILRSVIEVRLKAESDGVLAKQRSTELETARREQEATTAPLLRAIQKREAEEREVERLEILIAHEPEERQRAVAEALQQKHALDAQLGPAEAAKKAARIELGEAKIKLDEVRPLYDEVVAAESRAEQVATMKSKIAEAERDIQAIEEENRRLQTEINNAPSAQCCAVM